MFYSNIVALIPFYDTYGQNSTCILFEDGSEEYASCSIKTYLSRMLYTFHLDPKALKHWTHQVIGSKLNTPVIIDNNLIFLPVKLRKSVGTQDGCFGFVNNRFIIAACDYQLTLVNDYLLPTLSPKSYIIKKQTDAKLLSYAYVDYKKQFEFMWKD